MFTILIVDDNLYDRECIRRLVNWGELGIQVCGVASNGMEGYQKAIEMKPDFILADIAMPVMDGLDMTEKIRAELPETRFIFMSCHDEFDFAKAAIDLDVSAYVLKPVDMDELVTAVKKVIAMRNEERAQEEYQEKLKSQIRESMPILQEDLVRDLLHGRITNKDEITSRLEYLGMHIGSRFIIVLFQIDNYSLAFSNAAIDVKYLTIYSLRNIVKESLLESPEGYLLIQDYSNLCVMLSGDWATREKAFESLMDKCITCREQINRILNLKVTIGISSMSDNLCEITKLYQEAEYAVKSKFYSRGNSIILASELVDRDKDPDIDFVGIRKEIELLLDSGNENDAAGLLEKYYSRDKHYSESYVKSLCYSILMAVRIYLSEKNENFGSIFGDEHLVWNKLSKFETILDIKQWMINVISAVKEHVEKKQTGRQLNIVQDIKDIIDREYAVIQNIRQISDKLYISSGYANYIFKQETGITIGDYLFEKRMEAAKMLLQDPYSRIYEIAENVGYVSKSYFGAAFKEYTGMTPREYRDIFCK